MQINHTKENDRERRKVKTMAPYKLLTYLLRIKVAKPSGSNWTMQLFCQKFPV